MRRATRKQIAFIQTLRDERIKTPLAQSIAKCALDLDAEEALAFDKAEDVITTLSSIPRDVFQREIPDGVDPKPGFYPLDDSVYEIERVRSGRYAGYIRVYRLELIDLEDGGTAWERKRQTREATTRILERLG